MIAGANWWRANEIVVIRHLTDRTKTRYRSGDSAGKQYDRVVDSPPSWRAAVVVVLEFW